jgi:alkylation response protein AidB-like acyl-CoA dehydrogenase
LNMHLEVSTSIVRKTKPKLGGVDLFQALVEGKTVACIAVTEDAAGVEVERTATSAVREGAGWKIEGAKKYITVAKTADVAILLARTSASGPAPLSFFAVPRGDNGYRVVAELEKLGTRAAETTKLEVHATVPAENLLGAPGDGMSLLLLAATCERLSGAAMCLGTLDLGLQVVRSHLELRGREVWTHESVRHRWADVAANQKVWWMATQHCAQELAAGRANERDVAALKLVVADGVERAMSEVAFLAGGAGYTTELPLERFVRDIRVLRLGAGSEDLMRGVIANAPHSHDALNAWKERLGQSK